MGLPALCGCGMGRIQAHQGTRAGLPALATTKPIENSGVKRKLRLIVSGRSFLMWRSGEQFLSCKHISNASIEHTRSAIIHYSE